MTYQKALPGELSVLTLNLHCYQEDRPLEKLEVVAQAILRLRPDIVALQECAQDRNAPERFVVEPGITIREGNMALWLVERLRREDETWRAVWDWAHYGWDRWEEGCSVLTRHTIVRAGSRYVTTNQTPNFWKSRKPVAALVDVPFFGRVAVFSCHLGWWDDDSEPFAPSFLALRAWQREIVPAGVPAVLVGDFNIAADSEGYRFLVETMDLVDHWIQVHPEGMLIPTIGASIDGWEGSQGAQRIDYVFTEQRELTALQIERIFTEQDFGRVSDHVGLYAVLTKAKP